jgi:2-octaprenyl-6-methoxyphenol hydroxylase
MALDDAAFLNEVDLRVAGRLGALQLDGPRKSWPLEAHLARNYIAQRLALVGDAAHGVHPIGGQGLNLGFRDVAALVECLADGARVGLDLGDADALTRYERWRRFDSAMSSAAYTGLNKLFSNDVALVRSVREVGLGILDRLPMVKRMLVEEAAGLSGELPRLLRS